VRGKLIRKSLKTDVLSVAKLRLADLEKISVKPLSRTKRCCNVCARSDLANQPRAL
jgi:hypothetical protein